MQAMSNRIELAKLLNLPQFQLDESMNCTTRTNGLGGFTARGSLSYLDMKTPLDGSLLLYLKRPMEKSKRMVWCCFRSAEDVAKAVAAVEKKMPKKVKRKRPILTDEGLEAGFEEYYDYIFPEEGGHAPNLKLLEMARKWKKQKTSG